MPLTNTAASSPVVSFLLKTTLDYPLSLRLLFWTLSDLFVKHRHFKQWWCERYLMCFKSLIWPINIFPCQACWLCYSPNTGMLNIWLLYVLVIVSPFLCQGWMPENDNWKYGVAVHLLLSQLLLHFCCWVCKIKILQTGHSAEGSWNISRGISGKETWTLPFSDLGSLQNMGQNKLLFLLIFSPLHSPSATPPEKVKGHKAVSYQVTWEPEVGGKFLKEEAEIPEFLQKIKQISWTHTIKSLKLIQMEVPRSSAEQSLVPHERTKNGLFCSLLEAHNASISIWTEGLGFHI